eukprot:gnl/TRDRNA2_/TRDRNA2_151552_c1_seq3.p2 gnl/TRDRNA2_/TRDRNA2_151552_c1~~gnl/TRDRNA2_/TRDRNA2_151552_c1_seq3.p2  ORF type:complete len:136 (+),score=12.35 gnl/TRDRNA2_/TRDRNA2_151552_c1_seq3:28-408(+)
MGSKASDCTAITVASPLLLASISRHIPFHASDALKGDTIDVTTWPSLAVLSAGCKRPSAIRCSAFFDNSNSIIRNLCNTVRLTRSPAMASRGGTDSLCWINVKVVVGVNTLTASTMIAAASAQAVD